MTSHLSSRVLWNWRKRERGKETLPRVRDSASSERENIGNSASLLSRVHVTLEGTRRNESLPPQERYRLVLPSCVDADCDRPIVDQINYRVRTENASARRSGGPISISSCFRRRLFKNLGVTEVVVHNYFGLSVSLLRPKSDSPISLGPAPAKMQMPLLRSLINFV
jgi:hypothetical protein